MWLLTVLWVLGLAWLLVDKFSPPTPFEPDHSDTLNVSADEATSTNLLAITDQTGSFVFRNLESSTHPVWVDLTSLSELLGRPFSREILLNLNPGQQLATSVDGIGLSATYADDGTQLGGYVWRDDNGDNLLDPDEAALAGVKVIDPGVHVYYVPFDDNILSGTFFNQVDSPNCISGNRIDPAQGTRSIISITTGDLPATWSYDHYEDGYESNLTNPLQASTLTGLLTSGQSQIFITEGVGAANINTPASVYPYDGRDRVVIAGQVVNFVRIAMAEGVNQGNLGPPVTAMAAEADQASEWGTRFHFGWGSDLGVADPNFAIVMPFITASTDNTIVTVDTDGPNGAIAPQNFTLNAGEVLDPNLLASTTSFAGTVSSTGLITADHPIQVVLGAINCSQTASFGFRAVNLEPENKWSNSYFSPIPSFPSSCRPNAPIRDVLTSYQLHNPSINPITVNVEGNATATIPIPGGSTVQYLAATTQSGIHFFTNDPGEIFQVTADVDIGTNDSGGDFDWGFSVPSQRELTSLAVIGWSDGEFVDPPLTPSNLYSLVFLTPTTDTIIFVDLDSDGIADNFDSDGDGAVNIGSNAGVAINAIGLMRISDPTDNSLQGATIYTPDYSERFAMVFGQDPCLAPQGGTSLDLGFTVRPYPLVDIVKSAELLSDEDRNGLVSPGDTVRWEIVFESLGRTAVTGVVLTDVVDFLDKNQPCTADVQGIGTGDCADWIPGSLASSVPPNNTRFGTTQDANQINDPTDSSTTESFRLEWNIIPPRQNVQVTFDTVLTTPFPIPFPQSVTRLANQAWICGDDVQCDDSISEVPPQLPSITIHHPFLFINKFHQVDDFPDPIRFDEVFSFTVVLSNTSLISPVLNTIITDTLPPQLTYQTGTLQVSFDANNFISVPDPILVLPGNRLVFTNSLNLAVNQTITYTFDVQLTSLVGLPVSQVITNLIETSADNLLGQIQNPGVPGDPYLDATEPVQVALADLVIDKDDGGTTSMTGGIVTYTLTYSNVGTAPARNVIVTETVPAGTTFVGPPNWSCPAGSGGGTVCTTNVGTVTVGGGGMLTFVIQVGNPPPSTIINTACIGDDGSGGPDPTPDNNCDTVFTPHPDLVISKVDSGVTAISGGQLITYTLTYSNVGTAPARNVIVTETVPAGATFVGPPNWSCPAGSGGGTVCTTNVGTVTVGGGDMLTFVIQVGNPPPSTIINTACIGDDGSGGPDPTPDNNCDTVFTPHPDLVISKVDSGVTAISGGQLITYTLTYSNVGTAPARNVIITETVPAGATFVGPPSWSCPAGSGGGTVCTTNVGTVTVGGGGMLTFVIQVGNPPPSTIINTACIGDDGSGGPDPTPGNNCDTVFTPHPDLVISKVDSGVTAISGGQLITYTLTYSNVGTAPARNVIITETVPAGATFVGPPNWSCPAGSGGGTVCTTNVGTVTVGGGGMLTFVIQVGNPAPTTIINTACIGDDGSGGPDPTPDNNCDTVFTRFPAMVMDKQVTPSEVPTTTRIVTYTVIIANTGAVTFDPVILTDILQPGLTYVLGTADPSVTSVSGQQLFWGDVMGGAGLAQNQSITVTYLVSVTTIPGTYTNTAVVEGVHPGGSIFITDTTPIPTAIDLLYFEADQHVLGILLRWATAVEYDNFGFRLLRGNSEVLAEATEIAFIPGQGHGTQSGALYAYLDETIEVGQTYNYWLVDVDFSGAETSHGPVAVTSSDSYPDYSDKLYLPVITK